MSEAERAFYEWWHEHGDQLFVHIQRDAWVAAWKVALESVGASHD